MIRFQFGNVRKDTPTISTWSDALLRITGDFDILDDGGRFYHEEEFCLVELAHQLHEWLTTFRLSELEFEYSSVETAENPVLWFRRGAAGWTVGTNSQDRPAPATTSETDLVDAVATYLVDLDVELDKILGVRLLPVLLDVGRWQE